MTPKWLELANGDAGARAIATGAEGFLESHDVPHSVFTEAAERGDYVSTVFGKLEEVGRTIRADRIGDRFDDIKIVGFWQDEIKRAAGQRSSPPRATND